MTTLQVIWRARNSANQWTDYVLIDGQSRGLNVNMGPLDAGITNLATAARQETPVVRASAPAFFDLGNFANRFAFLVERELDSVATAMRFKSDYPQSIPRAGKYRELYIDGDGNRAEREMTAAIMDAPQIVGSLGVTLTIRFQISGGLIVQAFTADT